MSNVYLKVTTEKKRRTRNFDFLSLKSLSSGHFLGSWNSRRYHSIFKLLVCNLKIGGLIVKLYVAFCYFYFERNYDVLKSKSPCFLLNKNINFNKMENPTHSFSEKTMCFSSYKNCKLKVKL